MLTCLQSSGVTAKVPAAPWQTFPPPALSHSYALRVGLRAIFTFRETKFSGPQVLGVSS